MVEILVLVVLSPAARATTSAIKASPTRFMTIAFIYEKIWSSNCMLASRPNEDENIKENQAERRC